MIFGALKLSNFLLYEDIVVPLDGQGLVHIDGENKDSPDFTPSNRSGKSTLIAKGLEWALFGVISGRRDGESVKAGDVVRRGPDDKPVGNTSAILKGAVPGYGEVLIARYRDHVEFKNAVRIKLNGEWKSWTDPRDADSFIVKLTGFNHATFRHVVSPGQGVVARFSLLTSQGRSEVLESVLQTTWIEEGRQAANTAAGTDEKALAGARGRLEAARSALARAKQALAEAKAAGDAARANIRTEIENLQRTIDEGRTWIAAAETQEAVLRRQRDEASSAVASGQEADRGARESGVSFGMAARRAEQAVNEAEQSVRAAQSLAVEAACDRCGCAVTPAVRDRLVTSRMETWSRLRVELKAAAEQAQTAQQRIDESSQRLTAGREAYRLADTAWQTQAQQLAGSRERMSGFLRSLADLERRSNTPTTAEEPLLRAVADGQGVVFGLEQEVTTHERLAAHDAELVRVFQGLRMSSLKAAVDYLNERIAVYLVTLLGNSATAKIVFTPKPSGNYTLDIECTASGGKFVTGSGGEQDRIDAAIFLAFIDLAKRSSGASSNILVLDEPGGFLDDGGKRHLVDIFQSLVGDAVTSLFLISHEPGFRTRIRRRWTVVRQYGKSVVEGMAA